MLASPLGEPALHWITCLAIGLARNLVRGDPSRPTALNELVQVSGTDAKYAAEGHAGQFAAPKELIHQTATDLQDPRHVCCGEQLILVRQA